jgi:hypothetical protein
MKFRYYVTNTFNGCIEGTNDAKEAKELVDCEDFFVIDSEKGVWLTPDGEQKVFKYGEGD